MWLKSMDVGGCEWVDGERRFGNELQMVLWSSGQSVGGRIKGLEFEPKF